MPQIPRDALDKPAVTDEEIWMEADERLRLSMEADGENRSLAIEDLEFEDGNQWPDDLYNMRKLSKRPTLTINMTRRCVREVCNNMRQQRPRIKVHPTGGGARIEDAKVIAGLIRHIEERSKASVAYDMGGEMAVKIGWGYWRIVTDYIAHDSFDQELKILPVRNPLIVYDDPSTQMPTGADRDWLLVTELMKRAKYRRKYPKALNAEWTRGGPGDDDRLWESKQDIRLAEYFRILKKASTLYQMTDGTTIFESDLPRMRPALESMRVTVAVDPVTGAEQSRKTHSRQVQWFRLNGRTVVDKRDLPGKWIPFIRCLGNELDLGGKVRRRGMVRDLKDTNRMLNYWSTCETELVALAPRAPFIVAEGQMDGHPEWKDANQKPYSALVYKPVHSNPDDPNSPPLPPPIRQEAVQIPAGVVNARQGAMQDLMALAGMPHDPRADVPGAVVSGRALRERQALTDRSHFQYYDNQTMAIAHTGEILLDLIPPYYSVQRMQRIIGEDGVPQMVQLNEQVKDPQTQALLEVKNNMTMGQFDVVMDTGPGYETKRQEGQEAVIDLLKTPLAEPIVKAGADLIVRNMDFAGADDLADRLLPSNPEGMNKAIKALPREAQGIVQALQAQLAESQKVIQAQAMELKFKGQIEAGWMQVEREKIDKQSGVKVHDTQVKSDTQVLTQTMKDTTARDVAEIHGATQLLNTNTEAAHDRRAAEQMIDNAVRTEKRPNGAG